MTPGNPVILAFSGPGIFSGSDDRESYIRTVSILVPGRSPGRWRPRQPTGAGGSNLDQTGRITGGTVGLPMKDVTVTNDVAYPTRGQFSSVRQAEGSGLVVGSVR